MMNRSTERDFVTEERLTAAIDYAHKLAEQKTWLSGQQCAERAVRKVFAQWLQDWSASIEPDHLPYFFHLISKVENQIGIHRCLNRRSRFTVPPIPQRSLVPLSKQVRVSAQSSHTMASKSAI